MNAKLAKMVRKKSKELLGGYKPTQYIRNPATGAIEVALNCTRGVYLHMKRAIKHDVRYNAVAFSDLKNLEK